MPETSDQNRIFRFGIYELDGVTGDLRKDGKARPRLQGQPLEVLLHLLERRGEVVTREEFRARLWPAETFVDYDHSLNTAVNKAREALNDSADNPRFIQTIPRKGYRFLAPVEIVNGATSSPSDTEAILSELASQDSSSGGRRNRVLSDQSDLPDAPPVVVRFLFSLIQVMYLCFYVLALGHIRQLQDFFGQVTETPTLPFALVMLSALVGIPVRLYFLSAAVFGYRELPAKFLKIFAFMIPMDVLWAFSPILIVNQIGIGFALAMTAALLYVPFAQRSLLLMGEGKTALKSGS